ncbi:Cell wall mannoprotein PIR3 [Neolecta irregularis DAH-3]|uniref:Cell wall mannoprotein PIR3 n=1 Tax=Neolecta irregularis (strain DAH-3) TaxID=1198029 RepID=A0A1U7LRE5_NEOID|nr:Cell wall mannoprotein PIR3 [Neolecta irregularis DAH-3]|eukprot:OLL25122.1 Cell wall mannoprotein PIR3 [Neolecta irregularis DAH-3]
MFKTILPIAVCLAQVSLSVPSPQDTLEPYAQCTEECPFTFSNVGQLNDGQIRLNKPFDVPLQLRLTGGNTMDQDGRSCYITQEHQVQCSNPPIIGAQMAQFCTSNGTLTWAGSPDFYSCDNGDGSSNIYTQSIGEQCQMTTLQLVMQCPPPPTCIPVTVTQTTTSIQTVTATVSVTTEVQPSCVSSGKFSISVGKLGFLGQLADGQVRSGRGCLTLSLTSSGGLTDQDNRTCYISTDSQLQCESILPTTGAITVPFNVTSDALLAVKGESTFYECSAGNGSNIYTKSIDSVCNQVKLNVVCGNCGGNLMFY